jgi:hypothetical protein
MRKTIYGIMMIGLFSGGFITCTKYLDTCESYVLVAAFCALSDGNDGRPLYSSAVIPREFFDPRDFGRGHGRLYGRPPCWYDKDDTGFGNHGFLHHGRTCDGNHRHRYTMHKQHDGNRGFEFSISERYAPLMLPDTEYDK